MKVSFTFVFLLIFCFHSFAQKPVYLGLGLGFDYGGIGIKAEVEPISHVSFFGGVGYNIDGVGYNGGLSIKFVEDKKVIPYVIGMYGYNGVIKVKTPLGTESKTYYGPSVGFGLDFFNATFSGKFSVALLVPFRSKKFNDDYDALEEAGYDFSPGRIPVAFSIGYNWRLNPD